MLMLYPGTFTCVGVNIFPREGKIHFRLLCSLSSARVYKRTCNQKTRGAEGRRLSTEGEKIQTDKQTDRPKR